MIFCVFLFFFQLSLTITTTRAYTLNRASEQGCEISIQEDLTNPQPLLLRPEGGENTNELFYLPEDRDGFIYFEVGQRITVACPNRAIIINGKNRGIAVADISCISGKRFALGSSTFDFDRMTCTNYPFHDAKYNGNDCLNGRGREISIGFDIQGDWINHITSCFDVADQNVLYTEFHMSKSILAYQTGFPRPSWSQSSGFYTMSKKVDNLYKRNSQRAAINEILGLKSSDTSWIHESNNYFLSRGHLVAKTDWVYGSQHRLTFYFMNAAPQFQTINGGNWEVLETNLKNFAGETRLDLVVLTGTHGVTSLPHSKSGKEKPLYLYKDENNNYQLPVPRLFWKIIYDPKSKRGTAFVTVNNPYQIIEELDLLCDNVCDRIDWLTWKPKNIGKGYSYCCNVDDLRKNVPNIPSTIDVNGLLL